MLLIASFAIIALTIGIFSFVRERLRILKFSTKFPGPPHNLILGNVFLFPPDPVGIFKCMMDFHKKYGKNYASWGLFNDLSIFVTDPKDLETILSGTKSIKKSQVYSYLQSWLGTGLLISHGKKWFQRRKIITPSFHFSILEHFVDIFDKQTDILITKIRPFVNSGEINIYNYATLYALDIISETSMGIKVHAQDNGDTEYVQAVKQMSLVFFRRIFSLLKQWTWLFPLTSLYREQNRALKILHKFTIDVIEERKAQLLKSNIINNNNDGIKKKLTLLDMLLSSTIDGKPLSNEDIREEVDTFMFEGHDTTTSGITFALYHLAKYPEFQDKVFEEVRSIYGDDPTTQIDYKSLQELKYLEMFIKESMRIMTPVPIIGRSLTEDTIISGVVVPAGTEIAIPIYEVHHNPDVFPDPLKFDPERFTPEEQSKRNPYSYIPFSVGPRNCIGQKFAMFEMKTGIAKIIRNYKILPAQHNTEMKIRADMVLKSANGVHICIEPRKY